MLEIQGKIGSALCFAKTVEAEAVEQIRRMCDYEPTRGSRIRIMPDVHAGKGCTIGTTMTVEGRVVPNVVGVDIGCGMYTVRLLDREVNFEKVDEAAHWIPSGMHVWDDVQAEFDLSQLRCFPHLQYRSRLECSMGTLGGGNHFIELDEAGDGTRYLVIHSGSRNLGKQVAEWYQQLAVDISLGRDNLKSRKAELIREYREQGRQREIEAALKALEKGTRVSDVPEELCWLEGEALEDYLHDVEVCQAFARKNRETMAALLLERSGLRGGEAFHTIHNYIDTQERILRKGAIAAHAGEKVLIPMNMRDGSLLAVGRGNPEWNWSAPHGAGRLMSRRAARETLSLEAYRESMSGIYTTSVDLSTLDEAPMAYKPMEEILEEIRDTVEVVDVIRPIYNFKAAG